MDAELWRLRGDVIGMRNGRKHGSEAEHQYRRALEIAHVQGSRLFELRAGTALSRHLINSDRRKEAREILEPLYEWFAEGFETPDLKEAKLLLALTHEPQQALRCTDEEGEASPIASDAKRTLPTARRPVSGRPKG